MNGEHKCVDCEFFPMRLYLGENARSIVKKPDREKGDPFTCNKAGIPGRYPSDEGCDKFKVTDIAVPQTHTSRIVG